MQVWGRDRQRHDPTSWCICKVNICFWQDKAADLGGVVLHGKSWTLPCTEPTFSYVFCEFIYKYLKVALSLNACCMFIGPIASLINNVHLFLSNFAIALLNKQSGVQISSSASVSQYCWISIFVFLHTPWEWLWKPVCMSLLKMLSPSCNGCYWKQLWKHGYICKWLYCTLIRSCRNMLIYMYIHIVFIQFLK